MFVETSLFFKTMLILCSQISVILAICFYCIREARKAYENDTSFAGMYFRGSMNMNKQLDLVPYSPSPEYYPSEMFKMVQSKDNPTKSDTLIVMAMNSEHRIELIKDGYMDKSGGNYFYAAFLLWIISSSLCTLFATTGISTQTGIIFFTTSSITFGFLLSIIMLEMDENDGFNALKIVFLVTLITGFIGYSDVYSFSESSSLALFLLIS